MYLEGQASQRGYAMAALLVMISIMAIVMLALLPVWRHQSQREKEAELAFRGEQYARAIYLFRTKNGNQPPPNVDVLVSGRYIRKKYKDPITGEDFLPIFGGQQPQQPGPGRGGTQQFPGTPGGRGSVPSPGVTGPGRSTVVGGVGSGRGTTPAGIGQGSGTAPGTGPGRAGTPTPTGVGSGLSGAQGGTGLVTVQSKSKAASIRIYNNASHYNEWQFLYNARGRGGPAGDGRTPGTGPGRGAPVPGRGGPGGPGSGTGPGRGPGRGGGPGRGVGPGRSG